MINKNHLPKITAILVPLTFGVLVVITQVFLIPKNQKGIKNNYNHDNPAAAAVSSSATIPNTNYPIPSGAKFVANGGNDNNAGTQGAPYATLKKAIQSVASGGTVVLRGGVYREGTLNSDGSDNTTLKTIGKSITIQAYPGEQAWLDGTVQVPSGWTGSGPFTLANSPSRFLCKPAVNSCVEDPSQINPSYPMASSPQMVFCNGSPLTEASSQSAVTSNTFYFNQNTNDLIVGSTACGKNVDITVQRQAFNVQVANFRLLGIGIRHYGSIENPSNVNGAYASAMVGINPGSSGTLIENSLFYQSASRGLKIAGNGTPSDNVTVRGSVFLENGMNGVDVFSTKNTLLESNRIASNNMEHFSIISGAYAVVAGSKDATVTNMTIRDNIFEDNIGTGFWCDVSCNGTVVVRNISRRNALHGLYYEISTAGTFASNLVYNNSGYGIKNSSDNTQIYNNTLVNNNGELFIYHDTRHAIGNVTVKNNILSNSSSATPLFDTLQSTTAGVSEFFAAGSPNFNFYHRSSATAPQHLSKWCAKGSSCSTYYNSFALFKSGAGVEANGKGLDQSTEPLFINRSADNYQLSSSSTAVCAGEALPAAVAASIGVSSSPVNMGALKWPGSAAIPGCTAPPPTSDKTPPTVNLNSPTSNSTVNGNAVVLAAEASDNVGVTRVDFLVDGQIVGSDNSKPYSLNWDSTKVSNASHSLQAKAYDAAGNSASSTSVTVNVSNQGDSNGGGTIIVPPITDNGGGTIVPVNPLPAADTKKVEVYVDGNLVGTATNGGVPAIDTSTLSNGTHKVVVKAIGKDGKIATTQQEVHVLAKQSLYQKVRNWLFKPLAGHSSTLLNALFASSAGGTVMLSFGSYFAFRKGWFHSLYGLSQHMMQNVQMSVAGGHSTVIITPNDPNHIDKPFWKE